MEKVFSNQKEIERKFGLKRNPLVLTLPDFVENEDGTYTILDNPVTITSYEQFCEYSKKHEIMLKYLSENYPEIISNVYKNALSELVDTRKSTLAGKYLGGKNVKSNDVMESGFATSSKNTIFGILRSVNAKKKGIDGKVVELPKIKRAKRQVMKNFAKNKEGYFIPEINNEGLVVNPSKDKSHFDVNFVGFAATDVTLDQVIEYLKAPFGDKADESGVDFAKLAELCKNAYSAMGSPSMNKNVQNVINYCESVYPFSFAGVKGAVKTPAKPVESVGVEGLDSEMVSLEETDSEATDASAEITDEPEGSVDEIDIKGKTGMEAGVDDGSMMIKVSPTGEGTTFKYRVVTSPSNRYSKVLKVEVVKVEPEKE